MVDPSFGGRRKLPGDSREGAGSLYRLNYIIENNSNTSKKSNESLNTFQWIKIVKTFCYFLAESNPWRHLWFPSMLQRVSVMLFGLQRTLNSQENERENLKLNIRYFSPTTIIWPEQIDQSFLSNRAFIQLTFILNPAST